MELLVACGLCGGDSATDGFLLQSALAAVISAPYLLRSQFSSAWRRARGVHAGLTAEDDAAACSLQERDDEPTR